MRACKLAEVVASLGTWRRISYFYQFDRVPYVSDRQRGAVCLVCLPTSGLLRGEALIQLDDVRGNGMRVADLGINATIHPRQLRRL